MDNKDYDNIIYIREREQFILKALERELELIIKSKKGDQNER